MAGKARRDALANSRLNLVRHGYGGVNAGKRPAARFGPGIHHAWAWSVKFTCTGPLPAAARHAR
jgi:hypothetical protein